MAPSLTGKTIVVFGGLTACLFLLGCQAFQNPSVRSREFTKALDDAFSPCIRLSHARRALEMSDKNGDCELARTLRQAVIPYLELVSQGDSEFRLSNYSSAKHSYREAQNLVLSRESGQDSEARHRWMTAEFVALMGKDPDLLNQYPKSYENVLLVYQTIRKIAPDHCLLPKLEKRIEEKLAPTTSGAGLPIP